MARYAANTDVSVEKSKAEIERTLARYGASAFMYGTGPTEAVIAFEAKSRRIIFRLPLPSRDAREFTHTESKGLRRSASAAEAAWEQACRQKWRALSLAIKAKLEAVASGITTFEDEFLAHIVMPDGITVGEHIKPRVEEAYLSGHMTPLLPAPKSAASRGGKEG